MFSILIFNWRILGCRSIYVECVGNSYRMDDRTMVQFNVGEVREHL